MSILLAAQILSIFFLLLAHDGVTKNFIDKMTSFSVLTVIKQIALRDLAFLLVRSTALESRC